MDLELLKYPVGKYTPPRPIETEHIVKWRGIIEKFPEKLENELRELTDEELTWQYRPEGWNIRQVVHHCADSHMNAFVRFKLALTENTPTILPYNQKAWARTADVENSAVADSLMILKGLHSRWSQLMAGMKENDYKASYIHPEHSQAFTLDQVTGLYAWHCSHHLAHIRQAIHYKGSF